ncbi:HD domain-containing protein [Aeoliella sp. ICT_H6.2]|uniref:HD domain-containing protein n=1 Tax=Aeoliella straminimaris TaxID=2954799 RepID=A0A9X2JIW2_9BACT|nr:HD domain-containing phosphohydrolase [Aeoliella straminimaris]MCO6046962.1 HD domain-containing protein [Aeoliella straminimaris]
MQTVVGLELERAFHRIDSHRFVELGEHIGSQICGLVGENRVLPAKLFEIARHDYFTFSHVTNVTGYAVVLAQRLGISDETELNHIAIGAMLHDIGKRHVPRSILVKRAKLTPQERCAIRQHPQAGYRDLLKSELSNDGQRMMAYQHHERIDGNGYPVCILGPEIHDWAKLLSVVDVFDALTGERPYRKPLSFTSALDFMAARAGTQFDTEVVKCWIAAITQK